MPLAPRQALHSSVRIYLVSSSATLFQCRWLAHQLNLGFFFELLTFVWWLPNQHCNRQRRSLWWGGLVVAIVFVALSLLARFVGVPFCDYALLMAYIPFTLWYVFGYSMSCLPLVPTCLVSELLDVTQKILPNSISWPTQLQRWPGCVDGASNPYPTLAFDVITPGIFTSIV